MYLYEAIHICSEKKRGEKGRTKEIAHKSLAMHNAIGSVVLFCARHIIHTLNVLKELTAGKNRFSNQIKINN